MTKTALALLDVLGPTTAKARVRVDAALLRTMVDEVERMHPADPEIVALRAQLAEQVERFTKLISNEGACLQQPLGVLIVDDDEAARNCTSAVVMRLGYRCRKAKDGEEALELFAYEPADIVIADWSMPWMTGLELSIELERTHAPYFILATAFHESDAVLAGAKEHVDDFLCKPIDLAELESRLSAAARLIRACRAMAEIRS